MTDERRPAVPPVEGRMWPQRLGASDVFVSRIGLGTAPLGGLYTSVETDEAVALVRHGLDLGVSYLDTAPLYGHGTAERRVGAALAGVGGFTLSTKVGRLIVANPTGDTGIFADASPSDAVFDFSRDGILRSLDESLQRLDLDRVEVVYLHDPDHHEDQALREAYPVLHELRRAGVVGAIGVGMNQSRIPTRFVLETDIDVVLLAGRYTLLDTSGAVDLFPACLERGVSVVIGGVFNSGVLADPRPGATYDYGPVRPEVLARARHLAEVCRSHGVPLPAAAIQFPLRHPAVVCVLTGVRSRAELDENLAHAEVAIPEELWSDLAALGVG